MRISQHMALEVCEDIGVGVRMCVLSLSAPGRAREQEDVFIYDPSKAAETVV